MTSNAGAGKAKRKLGFQVDDKADAPIHDSKQMIEAVKKTFRPEFFNRIDEVITFDSLTNEQITEVCGSIVNKLSDRLVEEKKISLVASSELIDQLAKDGFDAEYGARPLLRHIRRTLEKSLTDLFIDSDALEEGSTIYADLGEGSQIDLRVEPPEVTDSDSSDNKETDETETAAPVRA